MAAKKPKLEKPKSETCQVRFPGEQLVLVKKRAAELKMPVGTFIRLATLAGAGLAKAEIARMRKIADSLENISETQAAAAS